MDFWLTECVPKRAAQGCPVTGTLSLTVLPHKIVLLSPFFQKNVALQPMVL
jgi:hypothetical protein